MSVDRNELHELIDKLPEDQVASAADDLRRLPKPELSRDWPPEFFNIIDGSETSIKEEIPNL